MLFVALFGITPLPMLYSHVYLAKTDAFEMARSQLKSTTLVDNEEKLQASSPKAFEVELVDLSDAGLGGGGKKPLYRQNSTTADGD